MIKQNLPNFNITALWFYGALEIGQIKEHSRIVSRFETIDENGNIC